MIGALFVAVMAVCGVLPAQFPILIFIILISVMLPDLDMVFGREYHRRGFHSFFAAALYGVFMSIFSIWVAPALQVPPVITLLIVATAIHFLHFYRLPQIPDEITGELIGGEWSRARTYKIYVQMLAITLWFSIEFGGLDVVLVAPPVEYVFFAAFLGFSLHILTDYLLNSASAPISALWPFSKKQYRISKSLGHQGKIGGAVIHMAAVVGVVIVVCLFGKFTKTILMGIVGGDVNTFYVIIFLIATIVGIWSFISSKPVTVERAFKKQGDVEQ